MAVLTKPPVDLSVSETMDTTMEPDGSLVVTVMDHEPRGEPMEQHSRSDVVSEDLGPQIPREKYQVELHFMKLLKCVCLTDGHDGVNEN